MTSLYAGMTPTQRGRAFARELDDAEHTLRAIARERGMSCGKRVAWAGRYARREATRITTGASPEVQTARRTVARGLFASFTYALKKGGECSQFFPMPSKYRKVADAIRAPHWPEREWKKNIGRK